MTDYSKITALYSRLSVGDEDRDGGESNSIQNQKIFLENYGCNPQSEKHLKRNGTMQWQGWMVWYAESEKQCSPHWKK